jgi:hypothetical protein
MRAPIARSLANHALRFTLTIQMTLFLHARTTAVETALKLRFDAKIVPINVRIAANWYQELSSRNSSDEQICQRCAESYYSCEQCDCIIHCDHSYSHDDQTLCRSCYDTATEEPEEDESGLFAYDYKPAPTFYMGREETIRPKLYLGVEIEAERQGSMSIAEATATVPPAIYCKRDGSLENGLEMVSHPCSFAWWLEAPLSFCDKLREGGFRSYDTSSCGMHVHISKAALSAVEQVKLQLFFKHNPAFIRFISRRKAHNLDRWAAVDSNGVRHLIRKVRHGNATQSGTLPLILRMRTQSNFASFAAR